MRHTVRTISAKAIVGFLSLAILLCFLPSLEAQSFYGSIVGTITDATDAVIPGAKVTATNIGTNEVVSVTADSSGKFNFVNLVPATYKVEVSAASFKRYVQDKVAVEVGATVRIDSRLQVGATNEVVEVSTQAALLPTDSSTLTTEISGTTVQEMPLNGRNILNLIALAPGVVPTGGALGSTGLDQGTRTAGGGGFGNYQIGGAIQGQSAQFVDGVANNLLGGNIVALVTTQDAVREFSVSSSNATADFGRFAGGVVNMATKSGANAFHGSAWEYIRNRSFNANDFFSNRTGKTRAQFNQNQYGAQITGPIKRDKAFFTFTWEGYASATGNLTPTNVPTAAMQNGIVPETYVTNAAGVATLRPVSDPLGICNITHQVGTAQAPGTYTIANLYQPGLIAGTTCGDPTSRVQNKYFGAANTPGPTNFYLTTPLKNNQNQYNSRIDYSLSPKQRIFGRYTYWTVADTGHSEFKQANGFATDDGHNVLKTHQAVLGDSYTFTPTTVLDVRVNYVRQYTPNVPATSTADPAQFGSAYSALAPQFAIHTLPGFTTSGTYSLYSLANFPNAFTYYYNTYGINANLIKIAGPHSLKFGTELRLLDQTQFNPGSAGGGTFTYSTTFTGDEYVSFLLGEPTAVAFKTAAKVASYSYYQGYYISDTWQAARDLTLTLGLRYELPGAIAERHDRATVLLPNAVDPNTGITGTLGLVNSSLYANRTTVVPEYNLFAPRLGFSYRIQGDTVLRGGYGISYLPDDIPGSAVGVLAAGSPINGATTQVNIGGNPCQLQAILTYLSTGGTCPNNGPTVKPGIVQPFGRNSAFTSLLNLGSKTQFLNQNVTGPIPFQPYPMVQQYNVALSHQFKDGFATEIAYSGLKGSNIPGIGTRNLNELSSQYYSMGAALRTAAPCANAGGLNLTVGQCLRQYPYYNNVNDSAGYYARNNYRSVQAKVERRFGSAGTLLANYTYSRNMGNTDTQNGFLESKPTAQGGNGSGGIQDYNNLEGEYSLISYDVTNRAIVAYVIGLPFGKGKKYANNFNGVADALVSGWAVNGITTLQTGFPIFIYSSQNSVLSSSFGGGTTRPNQVAGCNKTIAGSGLARVNAGGWFNTSCFAYAGDYAFGNEPRTDPTLRSDGVKNFDFSIQKSTRFYERANLEFRSEFFNIFNRVQFAPPGNIQGSSAFGTVSYQVNKPRQIQLSLRVNY